MILPDKFGRASLLSSQTSSRTARNPGGVVHLVRIPCLIVYQAGRGYNTEPDSGLLAAAFVAKFILVEAWIGFGDNVSEDTSFHSKIVLFVLVAVHVGAVAIA